MSGLPYSSGCLPAHDSGKSCCDVRCFSRRGRTCPAARRAPATGSYNAAAEHLSIVRGYNSGSRINDPLLCPAASGCTQHSRPCRCPSRRVASYPFVIAGVRRGHSPTGSNLASPRRVDSDFLPPLATPRQLPHAIEFAPLNPRWGHPTVGSLISNKPDLHSGQRNHGSTYN